MTDLAGRLASACLRRGDFALRGGGRSAVYFDKYGLLADLPLLEAVAEALAVRVDPLADRLAGVALGAVPLATLLARQVGMRLVIVRPAAKDHGADAGIVAGPFAPGERAVLVEDVLTTGGAALAAVDALRAAGLEVSELVAILDREAGALPALAAVGVHARALFRLAELPDA